MILIQRQNAENATSSVKFVCLDIWVMLCIRSLNVCLVI